MSRIIVALLLFPTIAHTYSYVSRVSGPYRPISRTVGLDSYEWDVNVKQWVSTGYYDANGNEITQDGDQSFSEVDTDINLSYGIRQRFDAYVGVKNRYIQSQGTTHDANRFAVESSWIGGKFNFPQQSNLDFSLQGHYSHPLYNDSEYTDYSLIPQNQLAIGDGEGFFHIAGLFSIRPTRKMILAGMIGFNSYTGDQSQEIPYHLELAWIRRYWAFRLGVDGIQSLETDTYSADTSVKPKSGIQSSNLYESINRSFYKPYLGINYFLTNKTYIKFKVGTVLGGVSTDQGYEAAFSLVFYAKRHKSKDELKVEKFKQYDIEANVTKVSPRMRFLKIDRGITDDIEKGMRFDIYQTDHLGANVLVASGLVYESKANSAIVKVIKIYRSIRIRDGFIARGVDY